MYYFLAGNNNFGPEFEDFIIRYTDYLSKNFKIKAKWKDKKGIFHWIYE